MVPLYTNRSLARVRCGEYVGAGEDAGEASSLKIIYVVDSNIDPNANNRNVIWNPDTEHPELIQGGRDKLNQGGWLDARGVGVDLFDGYVKALRRLQKLGRRGEVDRSGESLGNFGRGWRWSKWGLDWRRD